MRADSGKLLSCKEWEYLRDDKNPLTDAETRRLHALAERAAKRLKPGPGAVLTRTVKGLQAGQVVGVLRIPGRTVEILPKIDGEDGAVRKALVHMLAVAWDLRVADGEIAALDIQRLDLLEVLIRLFADRLRAAVRSGLPRRYVAREEDLPLLRGRLDVIRQTTHLAVRPDRLACRFDELSEDTPFNRVLKAAVKLLARRARTAANARSLAELAARFESVGASRDPLREQVRLDRSNAAFHGLYRLARLFLARDWQSTASGGAPGFALLFPMNELFEKFVGRSLKRALAPRRVSLQDGGRYALEERRFRLYPDAVIDDGAIVLDTKWKRLKPDETNFGVEQSDVYQMLAYGRAYDAKRLILLYPWSAELGEPEGICARWKAVGTGCPFDIATVDVGQRKQRDIEAALRCVTENQRTGLSARLIPER